MRNKWQATLGAIPLTLIEKKANGAAVIQTLQQSIPGIIGINPTESKRARAEAVAPVYRTGNVFLNELGAWTTDYQLELENFPFFETDDQVDASTQLINYFLNRWRQEDYSQEVAGTRSYDSVDGRWR